MKNILLTTVFLIACFFAQSQIARVVVTSGTDSIQDNVDTYFYVNGVSGTTNSTLGASRIKATSPIKVSGVKAIQLGTVHGAVSGSGDSTRFYMQVSLDNTNWTDLNMVGTDGSKGTLTLTSGMYDYSSGYYGTLAGTMYSVIYYTDAQMPCYPYIRFKLDNDATGHKFPYICVLLKEL
jgi:hypothetical protein